MPEMTAEQWRIAALACLPVVSVWRGNREEHQLTPRAAERFGRALQDGVLTVPFSMQELDYFWWWYTDAARIPYAVCTVGNRWATVVVDLAYRRLTFPPAALETIYAAWLALMPKRKSEVYSGPQRVEITRLNHVEAAEFINLLLASVRPDNVTDIATRRAPHLGVHVPPRSLVEATDA